jgi:hypothetical protein
VVIDEAEESRIIADRETYFVDTKPFIVVVDPSHPCSLKLDYPQNTGPDRGDEHFRDIQRM